MALTSRNALAQSLMQNQHHSSQHALSSMVNSTSTSSHMDQIVIINPAVTSASSHAGGGEHPSYHHHHHHHLQLHHLHHHHSTSSSLHSPGLGGASMSALNVAASSVSSSSSSTFIHSAAQVNAYNPLSDPQLKERVCEMGAAACWGLGDWNQMHNYVQHLPDKSYKGSLYRCILALTSGAGGEGESSAESESRQHEQRSLIDQTRDLLYHDLTSMVAQSYERSYQAIVDAQVLAELDEIIDYKRHPCKRDWLVDTWWRRLQGCERSIEYWHRMLLVHSIVLSRDKDIKPWLKFASLCQKADHLPLAHQILTSLLNTNGHLDINNASSTSVSRTHAAAAVAASINWVNKNNQVKSKFDFTFRKIGKM